MKEILVVASAGVGGLWFGLSGIAITGCYAFLIHNWQDSGLTLIERYGIFGLFSMILLGIGTFIGRVGIRMVDSVNGNTQAVASMTKAVEQMIVQNQMALAQLSIERKDAVSMLSGKIDTTSTSLGSRIDSIKADLLRELDGKKHSA